MCILSFVGTGWGETVPDRYPWIYRFPPDAAPNTPWIPWETPEPGIKTGTGWTPPIPPTREEFDKLKQELENLKKLLQAAKEFDASTGQPDCEVDEKVELIKKLAKLVDVDLEDVFGQEE